MKTPLPFTTKKSKNHFTLTIIRPSDFKSWLKNQDKDAVTRSGFDGKIASGYADKQDITLCIDKTAKRYDVATALDSALKSMDKKNLETATFSIETDDLDDNDLTTLSIGWGIYWYTFDAYKSQKTTVPKMVWAKGVDKKRAQAILTSVYTLRNMVNMPANDCTPSYIEQSARDIAKTFQATIKVVKDEALKKQFPLVHTVGKAATEKPRLIDILWGKKSDPSITIVGKGVAFDTGGLNIKTGNYMNLMRKDMGGAAHALTLGRLIMALGLKVRLRVIIPAVENAVAGNAFRPGDIITSRKGITVENTNTDAEGRLILADALALACENAPDLLIDFATLTGSARAALGPDIPAMFATKDKTGEALEKQSFDAEDPVWRMPLWMNYRKHLNSDSADICNSQNIPGDLMYSALFLKEFVEDNINWVHVDCHAWELTGRAGRPKGAADTGLLALFHYIEKEYSV